jgi:hypothetical protein
VLGYGLDDRRFESRQGLEIVLFTIASRPALRPTQSPIQWVTGALSLVVKRPRCEADHSVSFSGKVENAWSCTSTHPYVFMAWYLVKHRNKFTLTLRLLTTNLLSVVSLFSWWESQSVYNIVPWLRSVIYLFVGSRSGAISVVTRLGA